MVENVTQLPVTKGKIDPSTLQTWPPFESLRQEINRMFDDFGWGSLRRSFLTTEPMFSRGLMRTTMPAVDVVEGEKAYEVTAELPGMDEKTIEIKVANGILTMKGEKQEQKQEKKKDYYLQERHYGLFERSFEIPETVDTDKIEATFTKGVLTLTLPKKADAQKPAKKVEVKAA